MASYFKYTHDELNRLAADEKLTLSPRERALLQRAADIQLRLDRYRTNMLNSTRPGFDGEDDLARELMALLDLREHPDTGS